MKKYLPLILSVLFHTNLLSQTYPNIDESIQYGKSDFSEIDELIKNGLPNKALSKLLTRQLIANSNQNLRDIETCYEKLKIVFRKSGKEDTDLQNLFFEQHKIFEKTTGPARNISARSLKKWMNDWYIRNAFSFDEESLEWPIRDKKIKLENGNTEALSTYYANEFLKNENALMRISSLALYDSSQVKYKPTLFDVLAWEKVYEVRNENDDPTCYFETTVDFEKKDLSVAYALLAKLEVLNKKFHRRDALAFIIEQRMDFCENDELDAEKNAAHGKFQNEFVGFPASNRFALRQAYFLSKRADNWNWEKPTDIDQGFVGALKIVNKALKDHPKSDFSEELKQLKENLEKSSLTFDLNGISHPAKRHLLTVNYRNLSSAHLAIYKVKGRNTVDQKERNPLKKLRLDLISEQELSFENDNRMLSHTKDFLLSELNNFGEYLILLAPSKAISKQALKATNLYEIQMDFQLLKLTNLIVRNSQQNNGYRILVNDAISGKPIQGAKVKAEPRYRNENGGIHSEGETDENGYFHITGSRYFKYTVEYKGDIVSSDGYYRNQESKKQKISKVYTDRSIYRPGQTVYFKTLFLDRNGADSKLLEGRYLNVVFTDNNSDELYTTRVKSNEFGSASGSFVLPKSGFPLGNVNVQVDNKWVTSIRVEEYKRPTFEVSFDKPKGRVVLGAPFTMTGKVMALAGYPISNSDVVINISENRYFPRWCFVMDEWREYDTTIVVTTDGNGVFNFEYTSDKPKDAFGVFYNFEAIVTDLSGEVQIASHSLYLGKTAYTISPRTKDKYQTSQEVKIGANVFNSQYEEQKDVALDYQLKKMDTRDWLINDLNESEFKAFSKKEFIRYFPKTRYYKGQKERYESVSNGSFTSGKKVTLGLLATGNYKIEFSTIDEVGDTIKNSEKFIVWNPTSKRKQHKSEFWIHASNKKPSVGDEVKVLLGSSFRKSRLMIAKYSEDGLVSIEYKKLKRRRELKQLISEKDKTGLIVYYSIIKDGKVYSKSKNYTPADSSKKLKMKFKTITEPLRPGTNQSWEIELSQKGNPINDAELLVGMYDASLDAFTSHSWSTQLNFKNSISAGWSTTYNWAILEQRSNWEKPGFNLNFRGYLGYRSVLYNSNAVVGAYKTESGSLSMAEPMMDADSMPVSIQDEANSKSYEWTDKEEQDNSKEEAVSVRENFNETAFFEPQIYVSADGKYKWNFTLPDALTKWKMMAFAHTKDLKLASKVQTFEARKELMIETFEPRFWRKGDSLFWVGKVVNLSEKEQSVDVSLKIQNLLDESDVSDLFGGFHSQTILLKPNESKSVEWPIVISESSPNFVRFEAEASTEEFADVVRKNMPILEGKERITLAQNFTIDQEGEHKLILDDAENVSEKAEVLSYSVTVQKQPLWTTMLSLTHVLTPTNELNETYFSQYYGASLAKKILNDNPRMKQALTTWNVASDDALTSLLEQNEELKALALSETPWLLDAKSDTEQLRRLGQLLNENHLNKIIDEAWGKLKEMQLKDGAWSWVGKNRPSYYLTQHFANGLAELSAYGISFDNTVLTNSMKALDAEYTKRYNRLKEKDKLKDRGLGAMEIEWLYIRSVLKSKKTEASEYYAGLVPKQWTKFNLSTQAEIGQWALLNDKSSLAKKIMASFQDKAQSKKQLGKYWRANQYGYGWYENKIETHARMIAFYESYGEMNESVAAMQKWLIQQKRTQMWDTRKSTSMACYALRNFGSVSDTSELILEFAEESDNKFSIHETSAPFISKSPENQSLNNAQKGAMLYTENDGLILASAQMVYKDEIGKIAKSSGDFRAERHHYIFEKGEEIEISKDRELKVGDIVRVKIKLISDRDMEYVHLEDPKASGWEPKDMLSGYRYENGFYYVSNRDSKTDFFIENLRKGTHTYEYDVKVTVKGNLQVGPAKATCYYAPSFSANTAGLKVVVK